MACVTGSTQGPDHQVTGTTLSSRLAQQLAVVHDPARHNTPYKPALKASFSGCRSLHAREQSKDRPSVQALVASAVEAYACGWSEDLLREQLEQLALAHPEQASACAWLVSHLSKDQGCELCVLTGRCTTWGAARSTSA